METEPETCAICLDEIKDTDAIFSLSCEHRYHHKCFRGLVFQASHSFVDCPLCRSMNCERASIPETTDQRHLELWFHRDKRCLKQTKDGTRCKKNAVFMNNGCCRTHSRDVLPKSKYKLYREYLDYVLESSNHWNTKVYMLDIARKLMIHYDSIQTVQDVQHYFLEYFHKCRYEKMPEEDQNNPRIMYAYYDLTFPPSEWTNRSILDKMLI